MADYLVLVDFPGIKRFVFGTSVASEIRGASAFLEEWGREELARFLQEDSGAGLEWAPVYLGGGSGMFKATAQDSAAVDQALQRFAARTALRTNGILAFTWSVTPLDQDFPVALARAHALLAARRPLLRLPRLGAQPLPVLQECSSCSAPGATAQRKRSATGEWEWLCPACDLKRRFGEAIRKRRRGATGRGADLRFIWPALTSRLENLQPHWDPLVPPRDFESLGEFAAREGYLGLVYMDGDAMGRALKGLESPEDFAAFSRLVDRATKEAFFDAVAKLVERGRIQAKQCRENESWVLPLDVFLLGGDDLVVVTTAEAAVELAVLVSEGFRQRTSRAGRALTTSAGVAIFRHSQPFHMVLEQAEELLRSAKRERSRVGDNGAPEGFIDVANVSQTRFLGLEEIRAELTETVERPDGSTRKYRRTVWPLPASQARAFWEALLDLSRQKISRRKIQQLGWALEDPLRADKELMRVLSRLKGGTDRHGPWESLASLLEIFGMWDAGRPRAWYPLREPGAFGSPLLDVAVLVRLLEGREENAMEVSP